MKCIAPGCDKPVQQKDCCYTHYGRRRRHGSFDLPPPTPLVNDGVCSHPDCTKPASAKGMCRQHYIRVWRHGSPDAYRMTRKDQIEHTGGYILTYDPDHPLAKGLYVYEHRRVYFEGGGPLVCHVCGDDLTWDACHIDHLDDDPKNNDLENLKPACPICNQARGVDKMRASHRKRGVQLSYGGEALCISEWAERLGISRTSIAWRLKRGWPIERALTEGRGKYGPKSKTR